MKDAYPQSILLCVGMVLVLCSVPASWGEEPPSPDPSVGDIPHWAKVAPEQIAEGKKRGVPVAFENDLGMRFVLIPGGKFLMGSPEDEGGRFEAEGPQHEVTLSPFYLAMTEVTNRQYRRFRPDHDSREWADDPLDGNDQPVLRVSYGEVTAFLRWLSDREGRGRYRLPSEAEWEYACRAGSTTRWYFGDEESRLADCAWYGDYADDRTHAVGLLEPNAWGLFDMHGNALEWCEDTFHESYDGAPVDGSAWVGGGDFPDGRILRGGDWENSARDLRSAVRFWCDTGRGSGSTGFRPALDVVGEEE